MITSFEVGAIFRLVDEVSQPIRRIKAELKELIATVKQTQEQMKLIGGPAVLSEINAAIARVDALAESWRLAGGAAVAAGTEMKTASAAAARATRQPRAAPGSWRTALVPPIPGGFTRAPPAAAGGFRVHAGLSPIHTPGGHARISGIGTPGMLGLGLAAYGGYEAAVLDDELWQMMFHASIPPEQREAKTKEFREMIQGMSSKTGFSYKELAEAATDALRQMRGVPGGGQNILKDMLEGSAMEARLKPGTSVKAAMDSFIGLAHMMKEYNPETIKKLMPYVSFLSVANPATMPQMVNAASYALPLMQNIGMDPMKALLYGTALRRAGAMSTKSGTWLAAAFQHALPPDPKLMNPKAYAKRIQAMRGLGLVDDEGKSTILNKEGTGIDDDKFLTLINTKMKGMNVVDRNNYLDAAFGKQGGRGVQMLADFPVMEQIKNLLAEMPGYQNQMLHFFEDYGKGSPIQAVRTTWADLNNVMADLGETVLPTLVTGLRAFDNILQSITGHTPKNKDVGLGATVGTGTALGGLGGYLLPATMGGGPLAGLLLGGLGGIAGADAWIKAQEGPGMRAAHEAITPWKAFQLTPYLFKELFAPKGGSGAFPAPSQENTVDGKKMGFLSGPPSSGGTSSGSGGDVYLDGTKVGSILMDVLVRRGAMPVEGSSAYDQTRGALPLDISTSYPG